MHSVLFTYEYSTQSIPVLTCCVCDIYMIDIVTHCYNCVTHEYILKMVVHYTNIGAHNIGNVKLAEMDNLSFSVPFFLVSFGQLKLHKSILCTSYTSTRTFSILPL